MSIDIEKFDKLPDPVKKEFQKTLLQWQEKLKVEKCQKNFLSFVKHVWPDFIEGYHHKEVAKKFNEIAEGKLKRLIINMPPRHTKSEFASVYLPAFMVGVNPKLKIIQTTHTSELAILFGRKAKNVIDSPEYNEIFQTRLQEDSKAAGKWQTAQGGEYYAAGVGGAITGRGADLLIIDDPHSEQTVLSKDSFERAYEWYTSGPRQRLQPGGSIIVVMTRWSKNDLTGELLKAQSNKNSDIGYVKAISGAAMFFKTKNFDLIGGFDKNIFLYFEENDYCKRGRKLKLYSYQLNSVGISHNIGTAVEYDSIDEENQIKKL